MYIYTYIIHAHCKLTVDIVCKVGMQLVIGNYYTLDGAAAARIASHERPRRIK